MTVAELFQMLGNKFNITSMLGSARYPKYEIYSKGLMASTRPIFYYFPQGYDFGSYGSSRGTYFIPEHLTLSVDIEQDEVLYRVSPATVDYTAHNNFSNYTEFGEHQDDLIKERINILMGDLKLVENVKHKIDLELEFVKES